MNIRISKDQLRRVMPNCNINIWFEPLISAMDKYDITTEGRVNCFLPSIAYESNECNELMYNVNTTRIALLSKFPKHFNNENVDKFVGKEDEVLAYIFQNAQGNIKGSDDKYKFVPRGLLKIVGRKQYEIYSQKLDIPLVDEPNLACQPLFAALIAANLFMDYTAKYADVREFQRVQSILCSRNPNDYNRKTTDIINYEKRKYYHVKCMQEFKNGRVN